MRIVDGLAIAFVSHSSYFGGLSTPSMSSTAKETGASIVMLLAPGVSESDLTDEQIRELLSLEPTSTE